jgi:hypothetical protein
MVLLLLIRAQPMAINWDPDIPIAAQTTIWQDYLEWIHPPKRGGDCERMPVFKVTWMEPPGVDGLQPVLWVKTSEKFGAILGLSYTDLRYVERSIWAQPVMVLREVIILRPCRPSSDPGDLSAEE